MKWISRSAELERRRLEKMLGKAELARVAGVSPKTVQSAVKSDIAVTLFTVDCLSKALDCERGDIATYKQQGAKTENAKTERANAAPAKPDNDEPRAPGRRIRMSDLNAIAITLPEPEPMVIDDEHFAMLTVIKYNQCFTAYVARDGERYAIEGKVVDDHGLSPAEAALLGARSGESARFDVRIPVGNDGHTLCVTAFTDRASTTIEMQDAAHKTVLFIARVVALEDLRAGAGLQFFMRERPSPWCLLVERIVRVTPSVPRPSTPARRGR